MTPEAACLESVGQIEATDLLEQVSAIVLQQLSYLSAKSQIVYQKTIHIS